MGVAFTATNKQTGEIFVGIRATSIEKVLTEAKQTAKRQTPEKTPFTKALQEFGFEAFTWEVLANHKSKAKLLEKRSKTIQKLRSKGNKLYNIPKSGFPRLEEEPVPTVKAKTPVKKAVKKVVKKGNANDYSVVQLTTDGVVLAKFENATKASLASGVSVQMIRNSYSDKCKTAGGFIFLRGTDMKRMSAVKLQAEIQRRTPGIAPVAKIAVAPKAEKTIKAVQPVPVESQPKGILFSAINQKNGMAYIGMTMSSIESVKNDYRIISKQKENPNSVPFHKALKEFGFEAFNLEVIFQSESHQELREYRRGVIEKVNTKGIKLYNVSTGRALKEVIQLTANGKLVARFDSVSHASEVTGVPNKTIRNVCAGYTLKAKNNIFLFAEDFADAEAISNEVAKRAERKAKMNRGKTVVQFSSEGDFVAKYASTPEAERKTGISNKSIRACCLQYTNTARSYIFLYEEDFVSYSKMKAEAKRRAVAYQRYVDYVKKSKTA